MASSDWVWNARTRRYHDTATGRILGQRQLVALRGEFADRRAKRASDLATAIVGGEGTADDLVRGLRALIKDTYAAQYALGRGGRAVMTPGDWGRAGRMIRMQYQYLQQFGADVQAGKVSPGEAGARAALYLGGSVAAYERGRATAHGSPVLPAYPGEGTRCRGNCRCAWSLEDTPTGWTARWELGGGDPCPDCEERARRYSGLSINRTMPASRNGHVPMVPAR